MNDAERLCLDPALRTAVGGRAKDNTAASTSEMDRFETETLSTKENLKHLMDLPGQWIDQAHCHRNLPKLILDIDSSVSETHGHQEGTAYNGHFGCTCYHPTSSSTSSATWNASCSGGATGPAPSIGDACCCR